jgi:hypothetical protein
LKRNIENCLNILIVCLQKGFGSEYLSGSFYF